VPWDLAGSAEGREEGGRAVTAATTSALEMPPWHIGVRPRRDGVATPARPTTFDVRLITPQGTPASEAATLQASVWLESWNSTLVFDKGRYRYESTRVLQPIASAVAPTVQLSGGAGSIDLTVPSSGSYVLRLRAAS